MADKKTGYALGLDIGSTTIKLALMRGGELVYSLYRRHLSNIRGELANLFGEIAAACPNISARVAVTGSGGLGIAKCLGFPFVQEVVAGTRAVSEQLPDADVLIELGGEDAKITYLKPEPEQRMNGTCAGGTGSFIDQMASLLGTDAAGLDELAERHTAIYPIASRCGVFAKTDLQPLLNEGAAREDLAASVFQAVVNQTVAGLAQGRTIKGNIVFLGGPLYFLPQLRARFEKTLTEGTSFHTPDDAQLFVAMGAARLASGAEINISSLPGRLAQAPAGESEISRMRPLFADADERRDFYRRHREARAERDELTDARGPLFLGIDAGSTTIKAALTDREGRLLYTYYDSNGSDPLSAALEILRELYPRIPAGAHIASCCVTGYGEALLRAALRCDHGEIETVAHFRAAERFCPGAEFVIDIGGQDMKCMSIRDGVIQNVMLNEACSSGCGSFIETFAHSLGLDAQSFAAEALTADSPVDLGTRCTVFMNSRVKQAQKEGAGVGDISAGLSYSVVRNALYKVIKLREASDLGSRVVVQGGTFNNDAVLRCFELISGAQVVRPDIAGVMGAFGAALIAAERWEEGSVSALISGEDLERFTVEAKPARCRRCSNNCRLTVSSFPDGRGFVSGNRCERGEGGGAERSKLINMFDYKYKRVFDYESLPEQNAPRGEIGVPRVLNIYENYPLWHAMLTKLGFSVVLSAQSNHRVFEKGMDTIPSESVCYPAKLAHGHVADLVERGLKTIFYPSVAHETQEYEGTNNHYNCPIVASYPEVIANNMDALRDTGVNFLHPFLPITNIKKLAEQVWKCFKPFGVKRMEAEIAVRAGLEEFERYRADIRRAGEEALRELSETGTPAVVLAGRPYHVDPEINHGIPGMINTLGLAVLSEDCVAHLGALERPIRVVDQWSYHTRMYEAAALVARTDGLELCQLNSFGCGLDAVTTDQVHEILDGSGRMYTLIKIDEINNLGAARIRMRSLIAAMNERAGGKLKPVVKVRPKARPLYTPEMKPTHTILGPQMSPFHFEFLESAFNAHGYRLKILEKATKEDIETGIKYVNNDACYPSIMVVGQLVNALKSGEYDPDTTSIIISQTGGGCRATNYIAFLKKALADAGFPEMPVISLNMAGLEKQPGFTYSVGFVRDLVRAVVFGDLFLNVVLRTRPYELIPGSADALHRKWAKEAHAVMRGESKLTVRKVVDRAVREFDALPIHEDMRKPRVGLVGEILVKFHPDANNDVIGVVEREGGEAVMPGLMDFIMFFLYNRVFQHDVLGRPFSHKAVALGAIALLERMRAPLTRALKHSARFDPPVPIKKIAEGASEILSLGNNTGEGWFLTGEMVELAESGVRNIICMQPFACLPNHVTGKGMIKELRRRHPEINVVPVDYDPGASEVNQLNRIKLMMATAFERIGMEPPPPAAPRDAEDDKAPLIRV